MAEGSTGLEFGTSPEYERLSVLVSPEIATTIRTITALDQISVTEFVRRAVSVYSYFRQHDMFGKDILIVDPETKESTKVSFSQS